MAANILEFPSIKEFIETLGARIEKYLGDDSGCIVYLRPDGAFYAAGLYEWLQRRKKRIAITSIEDDAKDLDEAKVKGTKILLVNNDTVTGTSLKKSLEALRVRKGRLSIIDIKSAVFIDRAHLADFSVVGYSTGAVWSLANLDALDLKIISLLAEDGRKSFMEIGQQLKISGVAVKNRVDKLLGENILKIQGNLNISKFYAMSAAIQIEAEQDLVERLAQELSREQNVYHVVKRYGRFNLVVGILFRTIGEIDDFFEKKLRQTPGIRHIEIYVGEVPATPSVFPFKS